MEMKEQSTDTLLQRRAELCSRIQAIGPRFIRGSMIERYIRCGKPGCSCARTPGHGPKHYLSVSNPSRRPEQTYVLQKDLETVNKYISNYKLIKELLEEVSCINRELLHRREAL
jgi:hypothetical protein